MLDTFYKCKVLSTFILIREEICSERMIEGEFYNKIIEANGISTSQNIDRIMDK